MSAPPATDGGDPGGLRATVRAILDPSPGRLHNTLLLVGQICLVVAVWEVFRLPGAAIACYVVLFVSRDEGGASAMTALAIGLAVIAAAALAILGFALSLGEPALRIGLITAATFASMLLSRTSKAGPLVFGLGFLLVDGLSQGDVYQALALQQATVTNTTSGGLPSIAFLPPEEALVHAMLWLMLEAGFPALVVIGVNLLAGRDPAVLLRAALVERVETCAAFCRGEPGAGQHLERLARAGTTGLLALAKSAARRHPHPSDGGAGAPLVGEVSHLALVLLAWAACEPGARTPWLRPAAARCTALAARIARGTATAAALPDASGGALPAVLLPLGDQLCQALDAAEHAARTPPGHAQTEAAPARGSTQRAGNVRFALKVTLAVMTCYVLENLLDWPQIGTCIVTCFFVALGTLEESVHKMVLRLAGALAGGALGLGSILLLMPLMTDLGQLLALVAAVTFLGGWIACGSPRIAYAGWQLAFAFFLTVLQGYGPTLDMQTARDRVVGILLGNVVTFLVFALVWPVRVGGIVRAALGDALDALGAMLAPASLDAHDAPGERINSTRDARGHFSAAIARAGALLAVDAGTGRWPTGRGNRIDGAVLAGIQALVVPVSAIADAGLRGDIPPELRRRVEACDAAFAGWLVAAAGWMRRGERVTANPALPGLLVWDGSALAPELAGHLEGREALHRLLARGVTMVLVEDALSAEGHPEVSGRRLRDGRRRDKED